MSPRAFIQSLIFASMLTPCVLSTATASQWIYNPQTGNSYRLTALGDWAQSEAEAIALGGHLVTVNDAAENVWLFDNLVFGSDVFDIWIGFSDAAQEGHWTWVAGDGGCFDLGDPMCTSFASWAPGQPDNAFGGQDYGKMSNVLGEYFWDDLQGGESVARGIIERPGPPPTGPVCTISGIGGQDGVGLVVHPNRLRIYVSYEGPTAAVRVIQPGTCVCDNSVLYDVSVGTDAYGLAVSPDGNRLYVAGRNDNKLYAIDLDANGDFGTGDITPINVTGGPWFVAVSPNSATVFVSNMDGDSVAIIDAATNTVSSTCGVGDGPRGIAVSPDGLRYYVAHAHDDTVWIMDATSPCTRIGDPITCPQGPGWLGIALNATGSRLYVPDTNADMLTIIDTAAGVIETSIPVGGRPDGIAVSPSSGHIFVAMSDDDQVWMFDANSHAVIDTLTVGDDPLGVGVNPSGTRLYAVNNSSENVSAVALGDVDGDGIADGQDVCQTTPLCLPVDCEGRPRADLNGDCLVDGLDIQFMVEQLLNQ